MGPVLIVEDDPAISSCVQHILADDGYPTVTARTGIEALHLVEVARPACIVLDLNLPLLDGHGVLQALREQQVDVPVLLMTSDPRGQRLGVEDGVVGQIPKPFDLDHLSAAVAMVAYTVPQ